MFYAKKNKNSTPIMNFSVLVFTCPIDIEYISIPTGKNLIIVIVFVFLYANWMIYKVIRCKFTTTFFKTLHLISQNKTMNNIKRKKISILINL